MSRCQYTDLASQPGVRSSRFSSVSSGPLRGAEAVAETGTPDQADALVRSVVGWRDRCAPTWTARTFLGTSALVPVTVTPSGETYTWTFVFDPVTDFGTTTIEQVILVRAEHRVAVVVVSSDVPVATVRTISGIDVAVLARAARSRLA